MGYYVYMHNKPHTEEAKAKMRLAIRPQKWGNLPEQEIVSRLLTTDATTRSIADEVGCSDSTIKIIFKKHTTEEQRLSAKYRKAALSKSGRPNPIFAEWRKKNDVWTGRKHRNTSKEKQSIAKQGKRQPIQRRIAQSARIQGISIQEWKEFSTTKEERLRRGADHKAWRKAVFARDNFTCQLCGDRSHKGHSVELHPHHIKPKKQFPELRFVVANGTTLCLSCHKKIHNNIKQSLGVVLGIQINSLERRENMNYETRHIRKY